jgi:uncharacterized protein YlxP (DUF503 family)
MFIGIGRYELFIPASSSLKEKRQVLRSVSMSVQKRLKVSIAEVDHQNLWQRAAFGVSCVSETASQCRKILQEVEKTIGRAALDGAEIVDRTTEVVSFEDL